MTPEELDELGRLYRKFMPLPSATQIIKLIGYTRKMEGLLDNVNEWAGEMLKEIK